jgi:hypothetical protein
MGTGSEVMARAAAVTTQIMARRVRVVLYNSWSPCLFWNIHGIPLKLMRVAKEMEIGPAMGQPKVMWNFCHHDPGLLMNPPLYCTMPSRAQTTLCRFG